MTDDQNSEFNLPQEWDYFGTLKLVLQELQGISRLAYELIQNADDVKKPDVYSKGSCISFFSYPTPR